MRKVIISLLLSMFCSIDITASKGGASGTIVSRGVTRKFVVHVPSGLPANPPLVFALHALSQPNTAFESASGWDAIADREKFVVVYPQGVYPVKNMGNMIGWDIYSDTDVVFLSAVLDTMAARYKIDSKRVYSTGYSMGGMMSYTLACGITDKIAAIGPGDGYPLGVDINSCKPTRPMSVCHTHGTADNVVPYSGAADWVNKFVKLDNCPQVQTTNPGTKIKKEYWGPCDGGNEVIFFSIDGMNHIYPTSKDGFAEAETLWTFFKKHPGGSPTGVSNQISEIRPMQSVSATYSAGKINLQSSGGIRSIRVLDVLGKTVLSWETKTSVVRDCALPFSRSQGGMFLVNVTSETGKNVLKVVIP
jgi:poly(hydroxyalkanoate) depolymerase family esterase